jgi:hypothetical protein
VTWWEFQSVVCRYDGGSVNGKDKVEEGMGVERGRGMYSR